MFWRRPKFQELVNKVYPNSRVNPNLLRHFDGKNLNQITCLMVEDYKLLRMESVSNASVNRELAVIKHVYNQAMLWGLTNRNPCRGVKLLPETPKDRWLTHHEEEMILNASPVWLQPIIVLGVNSGLRLSELLNLRWCDINLNQKTLTVTKSKNGDVRTIPLNNPILTLLQTLHVNQEGRLFNISGSHVEHHVRRVCDKLGFKDVTFHTLRHTFGSRLAQANINVLAIQRLMGHRSITMSQRYCHQSVDSLRVAVDSLCHS